ncbi:hypothetical protein L596_029839 [Steinernema carpocapsae]|uniref:Uncharacterized protein n=1 Tax=Steinernema carpocapsae TaxID=34508 RepID=A0A4U5LQY1_STECR|nr:hypothetical protein L596_029839 [Steinernema carpocapsae]
MLDKKYIEQTPFGKLKPLKSIGQLKNFLVSMRSRVNTSGNLQESLSRRKIDPESLVVFIPADGKVKPDAKANVRTLEVLKIGLKTQKLNGVDAKPRQHWIELSREPLKATA